MSPGLAKPQQALHPPRSYHYVQPSFLRHPATLGRCTPACPKRENPRARRILKASVLMPGSRAASPRKTGARVLPLALVYYWCKELATLARELCPIRRFGLYKPNRESRRADSNRPPAHYECDLIHCRDLQGIANAAYLQGFPFTALLRVAPYCAPGGIKLVSACCQSGIRSGASSLKHFVATYSIATVVMIGYAI